MSKNKIVTAAVSGGLIAASAIFALAQTSLAKPSEDAPQSNQMMIAITPRGQAQIQGTLAAVSGATLTLASWGGNWTIDATNAKLVRRFGGSSGLSEFSVGDSLQVHGAVSSSAAWTITATVIKNNSIQIRNVNFSGTVSNLNAASSAPGFTLTTRDGATYQVTLNSDGQVYVNGKTGSFSDLLNGITVRVQGVLDRNQKTILANRIAYQQQRFAVSGTISNLNAGNNSFTLNARQGAFQITLAANAVIRINGGAAAFADLQNGMFASASGFGDKNLMTLTASRVQARFVPPASGTGTSTESH